jgi:hypothetical protein
MKLMTNKHFEICAKIALIEILVRDEFNKETEQDLITDFLSIFRSTCGLGVIAIENFNKDAEKDRRNVPVLREKRKKILFELFPENVDCDFQIRGSK